MEIVCFHRTVFIPSYFVSVVLTLDQGTYRIVVGGPVPGLGLWNAPPSIHEGTPKVRDWKTVRAVLVTCVPSAPWAKARRNAVPPPSPHALPPPRVLCWTRLS